MCYGPEFISKALDRWAYANGVTLNFSRPGKPTDNTFVESSNGRLRDECLNTHWFLSLDDARAKIEAWRLDYNESRPHTSLGGTAQGSSDAQHRWKGGGGWLTPVEYAAAAARITAEYSPSTWMRNRRTFIYWTSGACSMATCLDDSGVLSQAEAERPAADPSGLQRATA